MAFFCDGDRRDVLLGPLAGGEGRDRLFGRYDMESNERLLEPAPGDPEFCSEPAELVGDGRVELLVFP